MSGSASIGPRFARVLTASAAGASCVVHVEAAAWTQWTSASFSGARGKLTLRATHSPALDAWLTELSKLELAVPGHLIAELTIPASQIAGPDVRIELEVLTVET